MHDSEKSDPAIVAVKPPNNAGLPAEAAVEPRAGAKGNANQQSTHRTQSRKRVTQALSRVRQAARYRKKERFTALLHHLNVDTLRTAFLALKRKAAPGVDGVTWQDYEADLEPCAGIREDVGEASAGGRAGQPSSRDRKVIPGADAVCVAEGHMTECVNASTRATRRGRRTWHARTLLARDPGDLGSDQPQYWAGPHREGEEP